MVASNEDDFVVRGKAYEEAWEILAEGCEVPPSWDVFMHEVEEMRTTNPTRVISVQEAATSIARRYRRVGGGNA